jgi:hypothetical protein
VQQLVASLDKRYVTVRGIMMHAEGYDNKQAMAWRFLQVSRITPFPQVMSGRQTLHCKVKLGKLEASHNTLFVHSCLAGKLCNKLEASVCRRHHAGSYVSDIYASSVQRLARAGHHGVNITEIG